MAKITNDKNSSDTSEISVVRNRSSPQRLHKKAPAAVPR